MQAIQSVKPALTPNYALQKRKSAASDISMTGRNPEISDKKNTKRNIAIGAGVLGLVTLAAGIVKFITTKKITKPVVALRISKTKAGQKALDAQAAINESLKGYKYTRPASVGVLRPGSEKAVEKFLKRYC